MSPPLYEVFGALKNSNMDNGNVFWDTTYATLGRGVRNSSFEIRGLL